MSQLYFCSIKYLNFPIFFYFSVSTLFLFNQVFKLFHFGVSILFLFNQVFKFCIFLFVSQLYFYSFKCLNFHFFYFSIITFFCLIKCLNFSFFFYFGVSTLFLFNQVFELLVFVQSSAS